MGDAGHRTGLDLRATDEVPGIMDPRGTLVGGDCTYDPSKGQSSLDATGKWVNTMNPECRIANQADVNYLHIEDVKFDSKTNKGDLGSLTNIFH